MSHAIPRNFISVGFSRILVSHALSHKISLGFPELGQVVFKGIVVAMGLMH